MKLLAPIENEKDLVNKEYVDNTVDAIEIGGRNYIFNSAFLNGSTGWGRDAGVTIDTETLFGVHPTIRIEERDATSDTYKGASTSRLPVANSFSINTGEIVTISFWYYLPTLDGFDSSHLNMQFGGTKEGASSSSTIHQFRQAKSSLVVGQWTKIEVPITATNNYTKCYVNTYISRNGLIWLADFKLEKGNKATDWTPAPEDFYTIATPIGYGTCDTDAATVEKVVTVSSGSNWTLTPGAMVCIKFTNTNTAQNPTLNINETGAKRIIYGASLISTSNLSYAGYANRYINYVYNGANYVFVGWSIDSNTTYSVATQSTNGLLSAADKKKLDGIAEGADAVSVTQKLTSGTEIGTVTVNGTGTKLYAPTSISGNAATATALTTSAGSETQPVYFKDGKPVAGDYILKEACTKGVYDVKNLSDLAYSGATAQTLVPTISSLAYWNGAYKGTNSNLIYCNKGKFGDIITESKADYITDLSISGKDITYTKGDGSTGTLTTQDTVPTLSNISGILPLTKGGTGSTTLLDAKKNLGIPITIEAGVGDVTITNNGWFKIFELPMIAWRSYAITMDVTPCNYINNDFTPISVTVIGEAGNASMEPPVVYLSNGDNSSILDELYVVQNNNSATESFEIWYKNTETRNQLEFVIYNYHIRGSLDSNLLDKLVVGEPNTPVNAITTNKTAYSFSDVAVYQNIGGNAATASALTTSKGSATQPVYFSKGVPTACTYTLEKSVPSDAKFTDTTYTSLKNPYAITIQGNGTTLTNGVYDGSAAKTVNITASNVGALPISGGTLTGNLIVQENGVKIGKNTTDNYGYIDLYYGDTKCGNIYGTSVRGFAIKPTTDVSGTIGTEATAFGAVYSRILVARQGNKEYGRISCYTPGTADTEGVGYLAVGNNTAKGTAGNGTGQIRIYGSSTGYTTIKPGYNSTSNITLTLPSSGGTIALTTDISDTKVKMTTTNPSSSTTYFIPFASAAGTSGQGVNDGIRYISVNGTASAVGSSYLVLGNATASGTAGNKRGLIRLYSQDANFGQLVGPTTAGATRTWTFPAVSGTVITTGNASSVISGGLSTATNQPTSVDITLTKSFYRVRLNTGYLVSQSTRVNQWNIYTEALSSSTDFTSNPITLYSNAATTTSGGTVTLKVASKVLTISLGTATTATYVVEQFY